MSVAVPAFFAFALCAALWTVLRALRTHLPAVRALRQQVAALHAPATTTAITLRPMPANYRLLHCAPQAWPDPPTRALPAHPRALARKDTLNSHSRRAVIRCQLEAAAA